MVALEPADEVGGALTPFAKTRAVRTCFVGASGLTIRIGGKGLSNLPALRYHPSQCGINGGAVMTTKGLALAICASSVLLASGDLAWSASSTKTSLLRGAAISTTDTSDNTVTNTVTNTNSATGGHSTATNSNTNVAVAIAIQRQRQSQQQQQQQLQHQRQSVSRH
jgi:hypothetical protein